jgi:hypothetical protein
MTARSHFVPITTKAKEQLDLIEHYRQHLERQIRPIVARFNRRMAGLPAQLSVEVKVDFDVNRDPRLDLVKEPS